MNLMRLLLMTIAARAATSADVPFTDSDLCGDSSAQSCLLVEGMKLKPELSVSLAQKSWSRGKVTFPNTQQGSLGIVVSMVLAGLLFLSVFFAYGGVQQFSDVSGISVSLEHPRRLRQGLTKVLGSLSLEAATTKSTQEAARRTVASLRLRSIRHRIVRLDQGDDGILDDDRDSAKIAGFLAKAKAYAQRQQYEKASKIYKKAVHMAKDLLDDLRKDKSGPLELDEAQHKLSDAYLQSAAFYIERGKIKSAQQVLVKSETVIKGRTDNVAMRTRLLTGNARRDAGELDDAVVAYKDLLAKIAAEDKETSPLEHAMLNELTAETNGELARTMLSQGKGAEAQDLLEETLKNLEASEAAVPQLPSILLTARLKGWLGCAHLKEAHPAKAIDLLDASLAGLGELSAGLAGATMEVQELLQSRASAKASMGRLHNAAEDLEVVRGLQQELMQTVADEHNPRYAAGHGKVPDPRLWVSMARTITIAAGLKLQTKAPAEALSLGRQALELLREVKTSIGRVPKGYSLATFAEVKDLIAQAKFQHPTTPQLLAGPEHEATPSHDDSDVSLGDSELSHNDSEPCEAIESSQEEPGARHKGGFLAAKPGIASIAKAAEEVVAAS